MNYNKTLIAGNLTRDPEMRYTPKGTAICTIGVAVNRKWKTESGEQKEEVTFVDVSAFGKTAETISQYFKKGRPIFIEGRLKTESWDDKQTGQKRSRMVVVCESFQFVGGKEGVAEPSKTTSPATAKAATAKAAEAAEDDDVPF